MEEHKFLDRGRVLQEYYMKYNVSPSAIDVKLIREKKLRNLKDVVNQIFTKFSCANNQIANNSLNFLVD